MNMLLHRFAYMSDRTLGKLYVQGAVFYTIEKPWVVTAAHKGGFPYQSCVPDGVYDLSPHTRPNGDKAWILENPSLDVVKYEHDLTTEGGRFLILIHAGNYVKDVVGCIAPGLQANEQMVLESRKAMKSLYEVLGHTDTHVLSIKPRGAVN